MLSLLSGRLVWKGFGTRSDVDFIYSFNLISLSGASFLLPLQMPIYFYLLWNCTFKFVSCRILGSTVQYTIDRMNIPLHLCRQSILLYCYKEYAL